MTLRLKSIINYEAKLISHWNGWTAYKKNSGRPTDCRRLLVLNSWQYMCHFLWTIQTIPPQLVYNAFSIKVHVRWPSKKYTKSSICYFVMLSTEVKIVHVTFVAWVPPSLVYIYIDIYIACICTYKGYISIHQPCFLKAQLIRVCLVSWSPLPLQAGNTVTAFLTAVFDNNHWTWISPVVIDKGILWRWIHTHTRTIT